MTLMCDHLSGHGRTGGTIFDRMKLLIAFFTLIFSFHLNAQSVPCPTDTISGIIYYQGTSSTSSTITNGYFIAKCGGYQIGRFAYSDAPIFIPAYFIRNDGLVNGKRQVNSYVRQRNEGSFVDAHFKKIPFEAVYGLLVVKEQKSLVVNEQKPL